MANDYCIVNTETGHKIFQYINSTFARAVESAQDAAMQLDTPVAVMSHFCDADNKHLFKSELYVAQP